MLASVWGGGAPCLTLPPVHGDAHIACVVLALCDAVLAACVREYSQITELTNKAIPLGNFKKLSLLLQSGLNFSGFLTDPV